MTESPTPETPAPTKPERGGYGVYLSVFALTLSLMAIAVAGVTLEKQRNTRPAPITSPPRDDATLRKVEEQLSTLTDDLAAAKDDIHALNEGLSEVSSGPAADTSAMQESIDALREELASAQDATSQRLQQMDERMQGISSPALRADVRLAYSLLREQVESGEAYANELRQLRELMPEATSDPAFGTLEAHAADGIATVAQLNQSLQPLLDVPATVDAPSPRDATGWRAQTVGALTKLVKVERIGEHASPLRTLDDIKLTMASGDVKATRKAIERLPETDREAFEEWSDEAAAYEETRSGLHALGATVLRYQPHALPAAEKKPEEAPAPPAPSRPAPTPASPPKPAPAPQPSVQPDRS